MGTLTDTTWKAAERRIAARLRGTRAPLSGRNGGAGTSGDYVSGVPGRKWLYAEIKHYTRAAILTLFRDTEAKAKRESRRPLVVMHEKGTQNYVAVLDFDDLCRLLDIADANGSVVEIDWKGTST